MAVRHKRRIAAITSVWIVSVAAQRSGTKMHWLAEVPSCAPYYEADNIASV